MSEDLATGTDFTLANHGLKPAPTEPAPVEPETFGPGIQGVVDAGNALTRERGASDEPPLVKRNLEWRTGEKAGQTVDLKAERMSLTTEQAAKTLSEVHRTEDAMEAHANLSELAREVDLARAQVSGRPDPMQEAPPVPDGTPAHPDSPQPESSEAPSGLDPDFAALLERKPELRAQLQADLGQVETARQAYAGATAQVAGLLVAELAADLPEIMSLPPEQRLVGLQILQKQQPERFAAVEAKAGRIQAVVNAQQQNAAVEAQQQRQALQTWSKQQDDAFDRANRNESPETIRAAAKEIVDFAKSSGISQESMAQLWATNPVLRAAPFQQLMLDAAKYRMAQRTATANPASRGNIPPVQRPGIALSAAERSTVDLSELRNEFKKATGNRQLELGARLTRLQRESRR